MKELAERILRKMPPAAQQNEAVVSTFGLYWYSESGPVWLAEGSTLKAYNLKNGDKLEFKQKPQNIRFSKGPNLVPTPTASKESPSTSSPRPPITSAATAKVQASTLWMPSRPASIYDSGGAGGKEEKDNFEDLDSLISDFDEESSEGSSFIKDPMDPVEDVFQENNIYEEEEGGVDSSSLFAPPNEYRSSTYLESKPNYESKSSSFLDSSRSTYEDNSSSTYDDYYSSSNNRNSSKSNNNSISNKESYSDSGAGAGGSLFNYADFKDEIQQTIRAAMKTAPAHLLNGGYPPPKDKREEINSLETILQDALSGIEDGFVDLDMAKMYITSALCIVRSL